MMYMCAKAQWKREPGGFLDSPRRSRNLPDYSVISLKVETSFSQCQHFHLSKQPSCSNYQWLMFFKAQKEEINTSSHFVKYWIADFVWCKTKC